MAEMKKRRRGDNRSTDVKTGENMSGQFGIQNTFLYHSKPETNCERLLDSSLRHHLSVHLVHT